MTQLAPDTAMPLEARSNAYHRMADMLDHLGETWRDWPDLAACARKAGLSPGHFQRLFSAWAGLSPRQYQAALAHAAAGEALRHGASVLEASFEAGLSAPSRLHDLFIAHEGLSPGEAKAGGPDATLSIGRAPTPFGDGAWLVGPRGLIALGFIDDEGQGRNEAEAFADLTRRYPRADIRRDDATAQAFATCAFERRTPLPVALYGTAFRRRIWRALLDIPQGATLSYGGLATHVGAPKAARAVGAAVGANPLSWFIPCHRALAQDGRLHNYHWGVRRKRAMLALECVRTGDCTLTDGGPAS